MSDTTTVSALRWLPRPGGVCWTFDHEGFTYCVVQNNGAPSVDLWYQDQWGRWFVSHSRLTKGKSAREVAEQIHSEVTA